MFVIDDHIKPPKIFDFIKDLGNIEYYEMYQTFNMGMGMALIAPEDEAKLILNIFLEHGIGGKIVGHVEDGYGVKVPEFNIFYEHY